MLPEKDSKAISKFLSLVLRHKPEVIGITLDANGWTDVGILLERLKAAGRPVDRDTLVHIVETNNKKRFAFDASGMLIRASQGHSVAVELDYRPQQPPEALYHGTAEKNLAAITSRGLLKGTRHHVHLSADSGTAYDVGRRHGKPVVLKVRAGSMYRDGFLFYVSENGVWLTESVPAAYLEAGG